MPALDQPSAPATGEQIAALEKVVAATVDPKDADQISEQELARYLNILHDECVLLYT